MEWCAVQSKVATPFYEAVLFAATATDFLGFWDRNGLRHQCQSCCHGSAVGREHKSLLVGLRRRRRPIDDAAGDFEVLVDVIGGTYPVIAVRDHKR